MARKVIWAKLRRILYELYPVNNMGVFKQGTDFMRDEVVFSVFGCPFVLDDNSKTTFLNLGAIDIWS